MNTKIFIIIYLACLSGLIGCSSEEKGDIEMSKPEKDKLIAFSDSIVSTFSHNDFKQFNGYWDYESLKKRVLLNSMGKDAFFEHYFDTKFKMQMELSAQFRFEDMQGEKLKAELLKIELHSNYAIASILLISDISFSVNKFMLTLHEQQKNPVIIDAYSFKTGKWYSEVLKDIVSLNFLYRAGSGIRNQTNTAFDRHQKALNNNDTLTALVSLYEVPNETSNILKITMKKLELANALGDSVYQETIEREKYERDFPYLSYLYSYYYDDSVGLAKVMASLSEEVNQKKRFEELYHQGLFWE